MNNANYFLALLIPHLNDAALLLNDSIRLLGDRAGLLNKIT
jgi:hypothetical protein